MVMHLKGVRAWLYRPAVFLSDHVFSSVLHTLALSFSVNGILMTDNVKCPMENVSMVPSMIESMLKLIGELRVCKNVHVQLEDDQKRLITSFAAFGNQDLVSTTFVSCLKKRWGAHNFEFIGRIPHINDGSLLRFKSAEFIIEIECEYRQSDDLYGIYFSCNPKLKPDLQIPNSMKNANTVPNRPASSLPSQPPSSSMGLCSCCSYFD
jgi:hypothetical protein